MNQKSERRAFLRSRWGVGAMAFLGVAVLLLIFEHWTHIGGSSLVTSLLLLSCLGMHLFMLPDMAATAAAGARSDASQYGLWSIAALRHSALSGSSCRAH